MKNGKRRIHVCGPEAQTALAWLGQLADQPPGIEFCGGHDADVCMGAGCADGFLLMACQLQGDAWVTVDGVELEQLQSIADAAKASGKPCLACVGRDPRGRELIMMGTMFASLPTRANEVNSAVWKEVTRRMLSSF